MRVLGIEGTAWAASAAVFDTAADEILVESDPYQPDSGGIHPREAAEHRGEAIPTVIEAALDAADGPVDAPVGVLRVFAGTTRYVDLQVRRIRHDGRPAVLVTAKDITDWKELEAQLRTQRDNVELLNQVLRHDVMNEMDLMMQIARRCKSDLETDTSVERSHPEQLLASGERVIDLLGASQTLTDVVSELHLDRKPIPLAPLLEREVAVVAGDLEGGRERHARSFDRPRLDVSDGTALEP